MKSIGQKIKKLRESAGLTQQQVADAVSLSRTQIALLEGDYCEMPIKRLFAFAMLFGVEPARLLPSLRQLEKESEQ